MTDPQRWAWAEIDLGAVAHNVGVLRQAVAPSSVWVVVKADGYGHGSVEVARAALAAGAEGLCVALVEEGITLRQAGIDAPILVLSQQPPESVPAVVEHGLTPTVYTRKYLDALVAAQPDRLPVHLKIDTGMQRVGAHPHTVAAIVASIEERFPSIELAGVFTHLAVADDPDDPFTATQLQRFDDALTHVPSGLAVHVANSAGALAHPDARRSFVRAGIAVYGISPGPGVDELAAQLRPAMSLKARISYVKQARAGSRISYGRRYQFASDTTVATIPLGYADGVPRRLSSTTERAGGSVLIRGRRCPIVGTVTMDQLMVDCGDLEVRAGEEVVLIGEQEGPRGVERITATDWAEQLGTIGYEIVCGISTRVPRLYRPAEPERP
jgi:alanine racemase